MDLTLVLFTVLMVLYVGVTIYFGLHQSKKYDEGTVEDWFVASNKITWVGVGLTMSAAWLDMATVFLNTGGGYSVGLSAFWYLAGAEMITFLILGLGFGKKIRSIPLMSQPEMLEKRFSPALRPLYSAIWILSLSGYAALSFFVFQETFKYFFGLSAFVSALICLGIVLGYQLFGGFIAVVFADYIQGGLVLVGTTILGIFAIRAAGGLNSVVSAVPSHYLSFVGIGVKEVLLLILSLVPAFLVEPTAWMRVRSGKTDADASKGMLFAFVIYIPVCIFTLLAGLAAFSLYASWDKSTDLIAIQMARDFFHPVVTALVLLGIMAALISSFSAFMSAANLNLSYDLIPDLYRRIKKKPFPEDKYRVVSKWGLVLIGVLASYIAVSMPSLLDILLFSGTIAGAGIFWPVMAMFFWKRATTAGAFVSFVLGSGSAILWYVLQSPMGLEPIMVGFPLSFVSLLVVSLLTPPSSKQQTEMFFPGE